MTISEISLSPTVVSHKNYPLPHTIMLQLRNIDRVSYEQVEIERLSGFIGEQISMLIDEITT